jgi:hypothetical protein
MHLLLELAHFNFYDFVGPAARANDGRDWQWIYIACQFDAASKLSGRCHGLTESWHPFAERNSCCSIETTMKKPAPAQHPLQPKLVFLMGELFITLFL